MTTSALKTLLTRAYTVLKGKNASQSSTSGNLALRNEEIPPTIFVTPEIKSITDMMHSLNADSVYLHHLYTPKVSRNAIMFIEITHNPVMTVVIIVIPPGQRLPLHDHPDMLGLVKVLHGQVRVSSYSKIDDSEDGKQPAIRTQRNVLSTISYPQVLTPSANNVHEIEYVSGEGDRDYAAFLDILSPPYDDSVGCHYYRVEETASDKRGNNYYPQKCVLVETDCPKEYRTISMPYPFL